MDDPFYKTISQLFGGQNNLITLWQRWSGIVLILFVEERFSLLNIFEGSWSCHPRWRRWWRILVSAAFATVENGAKYKNLIFMENDQRIVVKQANKFEERIRGNVW